MWTHTPSFRDLTRFAIFVIVTILAATALMTPCDAAGPATVRLPGHVPAAIQGAVLLPLQEAAASQPVMLTIVLKRRDESGFRRYMREVYDRRGPRFQRFLTVEEITARFGPSVKAYDEVRAYLRRSGFQIVEGSATRMTLTVSGTRAQAERAFATHLRDFEARGRRFFANDVDPAVPAPLAAHIEAVVGLSNLADPKPAGDSIVEVLTEDDEAAKDALNQLARAVQSGASEAVEKQVIDAATLAEEKLLVAAEREAEKDAIKAVFLDLEIIKGSLLALEPLVRQKQDPHLKLSPRATTLGSGQKIGVLAFSSINLQDVADWVALTQQPASLANQVSQVAVNGGAPLGADETDVLMAVETILTVVPGAQVVVYHAPRASGTPGASFQTLFNAMMADNVTVISNSFSYCEDQTTLADAQSLNNVLATAAGAGITVLNATGDAGSGCSDGSANTVAVPADSPNATAVGATSPTYGPAFTYGSETWLDGSGRLPPTGQSGYGASKYFSIPPYQAGLISGSMRSVPDVVAGGDPRTGLAVCQADNGGCPTAQRYGGTSLSTPFWASVAALINQGEGHSVGNLNSLLYPLANTFHTAASMGTDAAHVGLGSPNGILLGSALSGRMPGTPDASVSATQATSPNPSVPYLGTVPADGSSAAAIVVLLQDANGIPVPGKTVKLSATGHAVITPATGVSTTSNGAVIFTVTDTTVENVTFTAQDQTDGVTLTQTASVSFIGPPPTAGGITANPATVTANGTAASTITVTLQDSHGNGVPGKTVTISQGSGTSTISGTTAVTNAGGQVTFTATDTIVETVTYTAVDFTDGVTVPGTASVSFVNAPPNPPCPTGLGTASAGFAVTTFAAGFPTGSGEGGDSCEGPIGVVFDPQGNLLVGNFITGSVYRFPPQGGTADPAHILPGNIPLPGIAGLAFSKDGRLYATSFFDGRVLELDPQTGNILRTVTTIFGNPLGLATDPISGDLFMTMPNFLCGADGVFRISNFSNGPGTSSSYNNLNCTAEPDGIAFGSDGTLYIAASGSADLISGTNTANPGTLTPLTSVSGGPDGIAVAPNPNNAAHPFLFVNTNSGTIVRLDTSVSPPASTVIYSGGTRGDFVTVGPDGCLYATQTDRVIKVTNADGSCSFTPTSLAPQIKLSPASVLPNPTQGTPVTFTATFSNLIVPSGTPVIFTVIGPNFGSFLSRTNAQGQATFTYAGVFTGTEVVIATATVGANSLTSNLATLVWAAGPHTTFTDLNLSVKSGSVGASTSLSALLYDVSVIPPVPVAGTILTLALGGQSCSATTNANGLAQCSVVPASPGVFPLTATFTGSSQFRGTSSSDSFTAQSSTTQGGGGTTALFGNIASKQGATNARVWTFQIGNSGTGTATSAQISSVHFTQTAGASCSPAINPATFPLALGNILAGSFAQGAVTIDFTGCANAASFSMLVQLSANGGADTGSIVRNNEER